MKQFYTIVLLLCAAAAQSQYKYSPQTMGRKMERGSSVNTQHVAFPENRDVIYTNDFSNCDDWTIVNAFDEGYTDFVEGITFECGVNPPSGPAAIDEIASTTADNGYMNVDSDQFGDTTGGDWVENCWFQNALPINCSGYDYVSVRFETFYRMWDNGSSDGNEYCLLEVSTDGVTWPDITTYEVSEAPEGTRFELWPTMETQDPVDNPTVKSFDISVLASNSPTVYLRFRWKGTWGYSWMIDDLVVYETPANDLRVDKVFTGDFFNDFEYTKIPTAQVVPVSFPAVITNVGYTDQPDEEISLNVGGVDYTVVASLGGLLSDTVYSDPIAFSNTLGVKNVTFTVEDDEDNSSNTLSKDFEVTQFDYSHATDEVPEQRGFNLDDEVAIGSRFVMNANAQAGGIRVMYGSGTDAGAELQAVLYEAIDGDIQNTAYLTASNIYTVTNADIDSGDWIDIGFDDDGAANVEAGKTYIAELRKYAGTERLFIRADSDDDDLGTVCWGPFGTDDAINWFIGWSFTPAIQLVLDPSISVSETTTEKAIEMSAMPNPANINTTINFELEGSTNVALTVRDVTGKLVESFNLGNKPAGRNTYQLNVEKYAPGMYSYTIAAGSVESTGRLMVK